jgi:acyl dehydratase
MHREVDTMSEASPLSSPPPVSAELLKARGDLYRIAPVPVSEWAIRAWCAAIGDLNPRYLDTSHAGGVSAPPPMLQSWVGPGQMVEHQAGASLHAETREAFIAAGFTAVVATDYEQEYQRDVKPGDRLREISRIEAISPLKTTQLGAGHFVTIVFDFSNQREEAVGRLRVRTFYFVPGKRPDLPARAMPAAAIAAGVPVATLMIPITSTLVIAGALASNDFEKVHHDRDVAHAQGFKDIILSIITTTGLVSRVASTLVPELKQLRQLRGISLRLGSPAWVGDVLTFRCRPMDPGANQFRITGDTERGQHVSAVVTLL